MDEKQLPQGQSGFVEFLDFRLQRETSFLSQRKQNDGHCVLPGIHIPQRNPHDMIVFCSETVSHRRSINSPESLIMMLSFLEPPEWILWLAVENPT